LARVNLKQGCHWHNLFALQVRMIGPRLDRRLENRRGLRRGIGPFAGELGLFFRRPLRRLTLAFCGLFQRRLPVRIIVRPAARPGLVEQCRNGHAAVRPDASPHVPRVSIIEGFGLTAPGFPDVETGLAKLGFDRHAHANPRVALVGINE
jgi:hypothetical protein